MLSADYPTHIFAGTLAKTLRVHQESVMDAFICRRCLVISEDNAAKSNNIGEWLSLVEHLVRDQGVGGSNPLSPTNLLTVRFTHVDI